MRPFSFSFFSLSYHFNPRICEGCDEIRSWQIWTELNFNPRIREGCDGKCINNCIGVSILIHASARDATAKSYKIDSDFTVLFRKFMQKLGIAIFTISIFLEKQEQYFCGANLPGFLRCFRFALTFSYIVCQNFRLTGFSV